MEACDVLVVGGGHNGLVAATLLARAGRSVRVLERLPHAGGASVSAAVFSGVGARLSRYSYLVSLFPRELRRELGLRTPLRRRPVSSYTPVDDGGLLIRHGESVSPALDAWQGRIARLAERLAPALLGPLADPSALRAWLGDERTWEDVFERPLGEALERELPDDVERGVVLTDALIGTFASAQEASLRQNRCYLFHVIGDGTGEWRVPVGGMGALSDELIDAARRAGVELRTDLEVVEAESDGREVAARGVDGSLHRARHLLWAAAPAALARCLPGAHDPGPAAPEGSQLKVNLLLRRLPRLRDPAVTPAEAFAGTFHVNESYAQLEAAHAEAADGHIPACVPCEAYCHSLTDPSILSPELRAAGAHTLTVFALHMPARLFTAEPRRSKAAAVAATLHSLDGVLGEPIEDLLWRDDEGRPCLEALTPPELEAELALPGGHIFHRDLSWPFAADAGEAGRWGVETRLPNVWLCGAGARRGGGVSGIPGWAAARAVLDQRPGSAP